MKKEIIEWLDDNLETFDLTFVEYGYIEARQGFYESLDEFYENNKTEVIEVFKNEKA